MIIVSQKTLSCILALFSPETPSEINASIKSLESALDMVGLRLAIATAAVVVGLLIEYFLDVKELAVAVFRSIRFRRMVELRSIETKVWLTLLGGVFVTAGVAFELKYEFKTSALESALQVENEKAASLLNDKASEADERSQEAILAQEQLRNENLRLQERIAVEGHRSLRIAASGARLVDATKPFAGQKFEIAVCPIFAKDFEVLELQMNIGSHLKDGAGWVQEDDRDTHGCAAGVTVLVSVAAPESTKRAAKALTKALDDILGKYAIGDKSAGQVGEFVLGLDTDAQFAPSTRDTILIVIGAHP